ncbi:LysR substrate-binding domain-containing protein [Streptomyces sp. NPDC005955]|uniref:LysR substrate-binding domain-containing protein n=1 Tax=Streptomyces sp. NPDC005955 TaxID=3364738 RepID=UPI0036906CB0
METRDIEIFLTLADELHFGRTAERLRVSVARVSQAIKKQERGVGAKLFERTSRSVRLTAVGEQLKADLGPIYQGLSESLERARLAAQGKTGVLRIGMLPSNAYDLRPYWEAFRARCPEWGLQIRNVPFQRPFEPLRSGEVDVMVSWLPVEEPDLTVGPVLFTEPRVMVVSPDHELADRRSVSAEAFGDHGVLKGPDNLPDYWEDAFSPFRTPRGRPIERHIVVPNLDNLFTIVSTSQVTHVLGAHVLRFHVRPDIVYLPVHDGPRLSWGLVWSSDRESAPVRTLAQVVRDLGGWTA